MKKALILGVRVRSKLENRDFILTVVRFRVNNENLKIWRFKTRFLLTSSEHFEVAFILKFQYKSFFYESKFKLY